MANAKNISDDSIYSKGFGTIPKFVMHDQSLSLGSKAIYAYMSALAGNSGKTFPYRKTILKQLNISKNTYYSHYTTLIKEGYITVERPEDKTAANIYTLVDCPKKLSDLNRGKSAGLNSRGFGRISRKVMQDTRLSLKSKGVYAYICSYCGATNSAFPLKDDILFHLKISEPAYYKALTQLKDLDYIKTKQRKSAGKFSVNRYYINEHPNSNVLPRPIFCDTKKSDTISWDTEKSDAFIITNTSINNISKNSESIRIDDPLREIARGVAVNITAAQNVDKVLDDFLPAFRESIKGKNIANIGGYMCTAMRNFVQGEPLRQALKNNPAESSYDLAEIERAIQSGGGIF